MLLCILLIYVLSICTKSSYGDNNVTMVASVKSLPMRGTILKMRVKMMMMTMSIIVVTQQIPHTTKSHHGGNMSLIGEVGFCHRHIPTIDNYDDDW